MSKHDLTIVFEDGRSVRVSASEEDTVYFACLKNRIRILTDCLEGACATCKAHCVEGEYRLDDYVDEALTAEEAAARQVLTCQMHALSDCVIEFPYESRLAMKGEPKSWPCTVASVEMVSSSVCRLVLAPDRGAQDIGFIPGQYVRLGVPGSGESRDYSFASPPQVTDRFTFYIKVLASGAMSDYVRDRARPGDAVVMTGPFGRFYLRTPVRPVLMVAGGTGLAPMLSMLDHMVHTGATAQPVRLLVGANRPDEIFCTDQVAGYVEKGLKLDAEYAVVEPGPGWDGETGHVTGLLRDEVVEAEPDIYLCGPPPMIEAAQDWLSAHGTDPVRVHSEKFLSG